MQLKIPANDLIKTFDAMIDIARPFAVDLQQSNDDVLIDGNEEDLLDFLTAYHDIDVKLAQNDLSKYMTEDARAFKKAYTPETALQKLNDFVLANGGFEDYDVVFEALNNAIHGIE